LSSLLVLPRQGRTAFPAGEEPEPEPEPEPEENCRFFLVGNRREKKVDDIV
jgi:hypothetical protein